MKRSASADDGSRIAPEPPQLKNVKILWLAVSSAEKYLLLEDEETGDVLLPLIYMKSMFEANYSRKLSSLKHRLVVLPPPEVLGDGEVGQKRKLELEGDLGRGFVYWQWAFESPHEVKVLVRQALGDPQGHLRLILLPIVYNAMAQKQKLRATPFFCALHRALRMSTYFVLIKLPPDVEAELAEGEKASLNLSLGSAENESQHGSGRLFHGPYDVYRTLSKYTLPYEEAEESDIGKRRCASNTLAQGSMGFPSSPAGSLQRGLSNPGIAVGGRGGANSPSKEDITAEELQQQTQEIAAQVRALRSECEASLTSIFAEIHSMRLWIAEVAQGLLASGVKFERQL